MPFSTLEDLNFADDLVLLSHTYFIIHIHDKAQHFQPTNWTKISQKKTKVMTVSIQTPSAVKVRQSVLMNATLG